jgi:hypothetical protein
MEAIGNGIEFQRDREEGNKGFRARRSERLKGFNLL